LGLLVIASLLCTSGCIGHLNRITSADNAVPAYRLPPELLAECRNGKTPIDFTLLRQQPLSSYTIGGGDTLGIFIQGVVPTSNTEQAPLYTSLSGSADPYPATGLIRAPVVGLPLVVEDDGSMVLPLVGRMNLNGMTLTQAAESIRRAYTVDRKVLQPGRDRIIITLIKPRVHRVLVIREDVASTSFPSFRTQASVPYTKRGSAMVLDLPSHENDVLHALMASGGLPGIDARNAVWVLRSRTGSVDDIQPTMQQVQNGENPQTVIDSAKVSRSYLRIPLRMAPSEPVNFTEADIILHQGDIVYLESRDDEVFFTGGLLPGGQFPLPRDRDIDVLEVMSLVTGSAGGPAGGVAGATVNFHAAGLGGIVYPTRAIIVRQLPNGEQLKVRVDLNRAVVDSRDRIIIQPGDLVMLQYKPGEFLSNAVLSLVRTNISFIGAL
jgi:protein involved in polysaccharide export with SLBB domain